MLVSDSQYSGESNGIKYKQQKVYKIKNGWLAGAGSYAEICAMVMYLRNGGEVPSVANSEFLWLTPEGLVTAEGDCGWEPVEGFVAIGSGAMAAEAVLRLNAGYTPQDAVRMACEVDLMSSGPIKTYRVKG